MAVADTMPATILAVQLQELRFHGAAAVAEVFGPRAEVQRCQWHKRENVVRYLAKGE